MTEPHSLYGYLTLLKNNTFIHKYKLTPKAWTIGGGISHNIRFLTDDDRLFSTQCVVLVHQEGVATLKKENATVPITINNKKFNTLKVLKPGDIIEISTTRFLYENDVLSKKKIKEFLNTNKISRFLQRTPSASKQFGNQKSSSRKSQSLILSNKNIEFHSEEMTPGKLIPTKKNYNNLVSSTSVTKTPMPDRSSNISSTRLSVSTGKIYKFRKPTIKLNNTGNASSHIPVLNKGRIRTRKMFHFNTSTDDQEMTANCFGKESKGNKKSYDVNISQHCDIKDFERNANESRSQRLSQLSRKQSNTIADLKKESFEDNISSSRTERRSTRYSSKVTNSDSGNTSVSDYFEKSNNEESIVKISSICEQDNSTTSRRVSNYNKDNIEPEETIQNTSRVSSRRSNKQAEDELEEENCSFNKEKNYAEVVNSSNCSELLKNMSLNETTLKLNRKSSRRSSKQSYSETFPAFKTSEKKLKQVSNTSLCFRRSNQSNGIENKLNSGEIFMQKSPNTSVKIPYNIKEDGSLLSINTDKEDGSIAEITTQELNSSEEVYRTPDSIAKIPKQIPKTPKSNVKSRKSVFLQEFEPNDISVDGFVVNKTNNDCTIIDNSMLQTPKTPKSNRKVRISDNIPIGQPSIVKDLRKSIASPEHDFKNKSSAKENFQRSANISSKSVVSINSPLLRESKKTPYSRTKRSSSAVQSPMSNRKVSIRNSFANVSTPKSNIKIRHSVTFEITAEDLQSLTQSSPRDSNGVNNLNEVSKPKNRSLIAYTAVGSKSNKRLYSKKRQRSSIHICLPEKRQKICDENLSCEEEYDQQVLQDISNNSSYEECIDIKGKTPTSTECKTYATGKRGFTDPKKITKQYKRRSLPNKILSNQERKPLDNSNDNNYSFISSTDTSSILFEWHPATNANNLLENNITLKSSGLNISGVGILTPGNKKLMSASEKLNNFNNYAGILTGENECDGTFEGPKQQKEPANSYENVRGINKLLRTPKLQKEPTCSYEDVRGVKKLLKTPKQQKEPASSYEDVRGVKKLLRTPKLQKEPTCSYEDVRGVKKLLKTPKQQKEPASSYEDVRGVKKLLRTPKLQKEPTCSYEDVRGVKKLLKTPKQQKEPASSYEDVRGIKKLLRTPKLQKEPTCSYEDVRGVKKLLKTPKQQKEPASSYEDVRGIKKLFNIPKSPKEPRQQNEPLNSYDNVEGVKNLFRTPKTQKESQNSYEDVEGLKELFKTPLITYSRKIHKNVEDDNVQISQQQKAESPKKINKINTSTPAKSLSESENAEKEVRPLRRTRKQIKTKNESSESTTEDDKSIRKETRQLRKRIDSSANINAKNDAEATQALTKNTRRRIETPTKQLNDDSTILDEDVTKPTVRTRRAKNIKIEITEKTVNEEEKPRPNTRTRRQVKKEEATNEKSTRTTRKQAKGEEMEDREKTGKKQPKKRPNATAKKYIEQVQEEDNNFEIDNSESENVITNLIKRNQSKRGKVSLTEDENDHSSNVKNETAAVTNNGSDSIKRRQPKRKKVKTSEIEHYSFEDSKHECDVNCNNDENRQSPERKQRKRRKACNITEIEHNTKIDTADDKSGATARRKRPRKKNEEETEIHQNDVIVELRTRRQKRTDATDTDKIDELKENIDSLSAKKTQTIALLEEEQQLRRSKRTPKTRKMTFESSNPNSSPVATRETRKRNRKN